MGRTLEVVLFGAGIIWLGYMFSRAFGQSSSVDEDHYVDRHIDIASDDSFPASDQPAWTSVTALGAPASKH